MKLLLMSLVTILTASSAMACSCAFMTAEGLMNTPGDVFFAVPKSDSQITPTVGASGKPDYEMTTNFRVIKNFKGTSKSDITVTSDLPLGGNCGVSFHEEDAPMIISTYKNRTTGEFTVSSCGISSILWDGGVDLLIELGNLSKK